MKIETPLQVIGVDQIRDGRVLLVVGQEPLVLAAAEAAVVSLGITRRVLFICINRAHHTLGSVYKHKLDPSRAGFI